MKGGREEKCMLLLGTPSLTRRLPSFPPFLPPSLPRSVILLRMTWPGPVWECPLPLCLRTRRWEG